MLKKMVDGKEIALNAEEEKEIRDWWAKNEVEAAKQTLADAKQKKITELKNQKIDELLAPQINAINNATNETAIKAVTL